MSPLVIKGRSSESKYVLVVVRVEPPTFLTVAVTVTLLFAFTHPAVAQLLYAHVVEVPSRRDSNVFLPKLSYVQDVASGLEVVEFRSLTLVKFPVLASKPNVIDCDNGLVTVTGNWAVEFQDVFVERAGRPRPVIE
jgi:hypothetical protein